MILEETHRDFNNAGSSLLFLHLILTYGLETKRRQKVSVTNRGRDDYQGDCLLLMLSTSFMTKNNITSVDQYS